MMCMRIRDRAPLLLQLLSTGLIVAPMLWPRPTLGLILVAAACAFLIGTQRRAVPLGAAAFLLGVAASVVVGMALQQPWQDSLSALVFSTGSLGIPWLCGLAVQLIRRTRLQARAHAAEVYRSRRAGEQLALAENLHDELGHALSLVALTLARLEVDPSMPPDTRGAVSAARSQLSEAVGRLGESVSILREGEVVPRPRPAEFMALIREARAAGANITLNGIEELSVVSAEGRSLLSRVLQESLTNAARHAPGAPVEVNIAAAQHGVTVTVQNDVIPGSEHGEPLSSGTGLESLSDHVSSVGGWLDSGISGNEFAVEVFLPDSLDPHMGKLDDEPGRPVRRTIFTILAGTASVALVVLGGLQVFSQSMQKEAMMDAEDFARIHVGDRAESLHDFLPPRELSPRPVSAPGVDCHDYAVTASLFDDAAGDAYRICTSTVTEKVVSTDVIRGDQG